MLLDGTIFSWLHTEITILIVVCQFDLMELKALKPLLCIRGTVDDIQPLNFFKIIDMPDDSAYFSSDDFR